MSRPAIRKWLMFVGSLLFAVGLAFMIIETLAPYIVWRYIFLIAGLILMTISNKYKGKRSPD
ncbi:hypothetical protein [Paenibacillus dakarensis]|uniref:hypothetical protein n=1 Tax=Paenibacillus dakarensis TaxID=1527293 RepID=UPI0006D54AB8|nr:hypothetical protein [Paenibacillus dakarensis]